MKEIIFENLIEKKDGKNVRKENVSLQIDCIYCNKIPYRNLGDDVLAPLMEVQNMGGFRPIGKYKNGFDIKYVVLYSTGEDIYWQDYLDEELGLYIYYGDNQVAGRELHDTKLGGNLILRESFLYAQSDSIELRKKIPPFFLFEKSKNNGVRFSGLLVPGYKGVPPKEWLVALWAKRDEGGRFQNYKSMFTVLDTSEGTDEKPNDSSIDLRWLKDLKNGIGYESKYAPKAWKQYIKTGKFKPLVVNVEQKVRTKDEQLPKTPEKLQMLQLICNYFKEKPTSFEAFAIALVTLADDNILNCENTRPTKDGGRDGIGEYRIMSKLNLSLKTSFAVEAKCYSINDSVGVKETSRLISRIKHRQFGVFVTTSFIAKQAYDEIIEDEHPIAIISGVDIVDILFDNQITNCDLLLNYLKTNFPLNIEI